MRLLIIEDEERLANMLKGSLEEECYAVDVEHNGEKGLYRARTNEYDAILLDDILPGKTGSEICRELRRSGKHIPILLMSVQDSTEKKVSLLDVGADDYITKPFSIEEMRARLRAILRRPKTLQNGTLEFGEVVLHPNTFRATYSGKEVYLTTKEFSLLRYLMMNTGRVLSRSMIAEHVWDGESDPFSNSLETHIRNLRRKFEAAGASADTFIKTLPGRGYYI